MYRPRKVHKRPKWALTPVQLYQLAAHSAFFPDEALSDTDLAPAWASVRDVVLRRYAEQCPGNRPWAWWLLESPMPRQCLQGGHVCPYRGRGAPLYYGRPGIYACPQCWEECYESQARFLRRNGVLLPWEEGVVPLTLAACDRWAFQRYHKTVGDHEVLDDTPHPWAVGEGLRWCAAVLREG